MKTLTTAFFVALTSIDHSMFPAHGKHFHLTLVQN